MAQNQQELVFAPLGGVGEIGMNLAVYGLGSERRRQWLAVDCGVSFAAEEHLPGVDLILPDIRFLVEERKNLAGIVITHAHEDHFGALLDLWPQLKVPVFATPFSAALIEAKCAGEPGAPKIPVTVVARGSRFQVGGFAIELVTMTHSIPETNALIIRTPLGKVLHTGDWKLDPTPVLNDPTDEAKLRAFGEEGCLALIGDSTNAVREGRSPSEAEVAKTIAALIKTAPGRVAVTTFASNAGRLRSVAEGAIAAGREVIVVGRAMDRIVQIARELGYFDGLPEFRGADAFAALPPEKVVALCTGSQGEPRAALARVAEDQHPDIKFARGDRLIYSARMIPGNEKAVGRVLNGLIEQGVEVITDRDALVHVSGHPRREELEALISWVKSANPHPGARRSAASDRARRACQALRRQTGDPMPQWRPGAAVGRGPHRRRGAGGPRLQGRVGSGAGRGPHRRRPPALELCRRGVGGAGAHRGRAAGGRSGI